MTEQSEYRRRQGPVTVLTLLFGLLLGFAGPPGAQLQQDPGSARLGQGEAIRSNAGLRVSSRSGEEQPDADDALALLPPPPHIQTSLVSLRPAQAASPAVPASRGSDADFHYQARAPPAA